jgi:Tfp pilus assembly protein PilX
MFNNKQKYHLSDQTEAQKLLQFILRAQQIAQQDPQHERGYAMVVVSIVSVVMFSMLGAYLLVANISKSSTNAYVDGTNTFYAAESGLNKRADQLRQRFVGYAVPTGLSPGQTTAASPVTPANIVNCFPIAVSTSSTVLGDDFECRNYAFKYNSNSATVTGSGGTTQATNISKQIDYTATTQPLESQHQCERLFHLDNHMRV